MNHTRLLLLLIPLSAVVLASCGSPMAILEMDLEEATLKAPTGEQRLRLRSACSYKIMDADEMRGKSDRVASLIVHGHEAPYEFALLVSPSPFNQSFLRVVIDNKDTDNYDIDIVNAQYFYNQAGAKPLQFSPGQWRNLVSDTYAAKVFTLELPKELIAHPIREHGDGILNPAEFQTRLESERYRFVIDVRINKELYALDVTLAFKLGTGIRFGVPAMP